MQRTIAKSCFGGYVNLNGFFTFIPLHPSSPQHGQMYVGQQNIYSRKQSLYYALVCYCSLLKCEGMVHVPASQPGGASSQGKGHQNFSTLAQKEKGVLSQRGLGGCFCWNPNQLSKGAGFCHGKLHPKWASLLTLYPLWVSGEKPCKGKYWTLAVDTCHGTSD